MSIRKILVPLIGQFDPADPESLEMPALEAAFRLGRQLGAHIEVFCVEAPTNEAHERLAPWLPHLAVADLFKHIEKESDKRRTRARKIYDTVVNSFSAPQISKPDPKAGFSANFLEQIGSIGESLSLRGRLADLIVTASFPLGYGDRVPPLLEIALRETGRPLLISPTDASSTFGARIGIAWNGSAEAARAVSMAMEFLITASEVVVISVNEDGPITPGGDELAEYLRWHGVQAQTVTIEGSAASAGRILLEQVDKAGVDLLIMGAYTRDRLRQVIFGGATREVLAKMAIPVLMVD
jgi:nucleotide-binding universal stress UspA family protein